MSFEELGAASQAFFLHIFSQTRGEKTLARRIEQNRGAVLDESSNLIELRLGEPGSRDWMLFHIRRSAPARSHRIAEVAVSDEPPQALPGAHRPPKAQWAMYLPGASIATGIAPEPR